MRVLSCETIRPNRLRGFPLLPEKDLKSKAEMLMTLKMTLKKHCHAKCMETLARDSKEMPGTSTGTMDLLSFTCQVNDWEDHQLTSQEKQQRIKLATDQKSHKREEDADCVLN
ncbi:hypothetical protein T4E_6829 [Trichinella pseudospiralis]|uniref:Uncharacterized protein n=1 Tax=Trichinella pseudospiralis TaxID=6337 RepID=A0A0V0YKB4_TRIPS|nr:hypothetical protein T4E_6829 [Trichinella pseudospiralis]